MRGARYETSMLFHFRHSILATPLHAAHKPSPSMTTYWEVECDRRFDSIATLELHDATYAKQLDTFALGDPVDLPLPSSTAYLFKLNGVVRASLFVDDTNPWMAVRFVYDPLMLAAGSFPCLRALVHRRVPNLCVEALSAQEQLDFLHLGEASHQ